MGDRTASNIQIVSRKDIARDVWNKFVDSTDDAWLWHRTEVIDGLSTWAGYEERSVGVLDSSGRVCAVFPCYLVRHRTLARIHLPNVFSLGGYAIDHQLGERGRRRIAESIVQYIEDTIAKERASRAEIWLAAMTPAWRGQQAPRVNPLLKFGFTHIQAQTWVVDLGQSIEDIRRKYSETTRQELRKANDLAGKPREAAGSKDLEIYYELHLATCGRTGITPHPFEYFRIIFEDAVPRGLAHILFHETGGQVTAAHNTGIYKFAAVYWTGASNSDRGSGANRILMDAQITAAKQCGCLHYEVGEAFPGTGDGKQQGLSLFKASFGGDMLPYWAGSLQSNRLFARLVRTGRQICGVWAK